MCKECYVQCGGDQNSPVYVQVSHHTASEVIPLPGVISPLSSQFQSPVQIPMIAIQSSPSSTSISSQYSSDVRPIRSISMPPTIHRLNSKFILKINANKMKLTTTVDPNSTVSEIIGRLQKKFPQGETDGYSLFLMESKNTYKILEVDKPISQYVTDKEVELVFDSVEKYDSKGKGTFKKSGFGIRRRRSNTKTDLENAHKIWKKKEEVINAINTQNLKALQVALDGTTRFPFMEELDDINGTTPLHSALDRSDNKISLFLINYYQQCRLNMNIKNSSGNPPLHSTLLKNPDEQILKELIDSPGVLVDNENSQGNTPLHIVCQTLTIPSCLDIAKRILTKGEKSYNTFIFNFHNRDLVAPNTILAENRQGEVPLHKAISNPVFSVQLVSLLVEKGALINARNLAHETGIFKC